MKEVFIKSNELTDLMLEDLPKQDLYSFDDILNAYEEALYNLHCLEEELEDFKENVEDNYRPIKASALYGVPESDYDR